MLKNSLIILSYTASVALAGDLYYAFFNDNQCKVNGGTHVDSKNDGCLKEFGRQGISPAGGNAGLYYPILVGYSDDNCQSEIGCNAMPASDNGGYCLDLTMEAWQWSQKASSFRFITAGNPAVCPNGCIGECPDGHAPAKKRDIKSEQIREIDAAPFAKAAKPKTSPKVETPVIREVEIREVQSTDGAPAGNGYYAYCSDDNCSSDCGTAILPENGGCSIEGSRGSVYYSGHKTIVLSGYTGPNQDCTGPVTGTIKMTGKGCYPVNSGVNGGPNSYQVTTVADA